MNSLRSVKQNESVVKRPFREIVCHFSVIIDPTKVVRSDLQNAASIASMVLITESLAADIPEKGKMPAMPPDGRGGMVAVHNIANGSSFFIPLK